MFQIHHYISENYQTYRGTQFNLTLSITNQNTSRLSTQSNIFWSIFNTLFSYKFIILHALPIKLLMDLHEISDISENYQSYRRTQFNLTLCDLPIKTLLTSQRNQIYSEASSTHFSAINLSYYTLYPLNSSWIYMKYPTFQKTIRVIVEHNSIWHSVIYQSKHFSPPNAIKYILKHLQHTFQLLIYHTLTLYPSYSLLIQINHRHFSTLSDLSRNTI